MFWSMPFDHRPSDAERLDAIRRHAHDSLRYFATAALGGEDRDWTRAYLDLTANYMALAEGDSLDDRSMLEKGSEIADRYLDAAKRDPWTPPCSFCGDSPAVAWFEGPRFTHSVDAADKVRAEGAWTACARCLELVRADDREGLVWRDAKRFEGRDGVDLERAMTMARDMHEKFWKARTGA